MKRAIEIRKLVLILVMAFTLILASCGSNTGSDMTSDENDSTTEAYEDVQEDVQVGDSVSDYEGKWTDGLDNELVIENGKALLTILGLSIVGTAHGDKIDFPNDYKKTEATFIDDRLVLTFTPFDYVIEGYTSEGEDVPENITTTMTFTRVE